jgi:uridine kinase
VTKSVPALIRVAEGFQEKRLAVIADEIQRRAHDLDIVCIAGPSASGKTTFIRRLCVQLQVNGLNPVALSLDDYYINRLRTPRDESGDYDFESLHAIDLGSLENHLGRLLSGELVQTSRYDFISGKSLAGPEIQLQPSDVLLLEGTHGLNPALLANLAPQRIFRIFVCPLMQLAFDQLSSVHVSDMRLIRRIVRDRHGRGYAATETILRWPKVRAGERQHIYPYQIHSDAVFDSSLVYEMSVLRVYAERYLLEVPRSHSTYQTAARLMHLLDRFVSIYPQQVPGNSILREFIGDSSFEV